MGMLAKIRRMHIRDGIPLRETTANRALPQHHLHLAAPAGNANPDTPPQGPASSTRGLINCGNGCRPTATAARERRTGRVMFETLREQGYPGSYSRVSAFIRKWQEERSENPKRSAYVPPAFARRSLPVRLELRICLHRRSALASEVAHIKLSKPAAPSGSWPIPARATKCCSMPMPAALCRPGRHSRRGIYDNMKTAVDRSAWQGAHHQRPLPRHVRPLPVRPRVLQPGQPAGRRGIVEKNVQDRRRQIWQQAAERRWPDLDSLNDWLGEQCRPPGAPYPTPNGRHSPLANCSKMSNPDDAQPEAFRRLCEKPVRVSSTALVHLQRNRYSVPTDQCPSRHQPAHLPGRAPVHRRWRAEIAKACPELRASPDLLRLAALHRPDRPQARRCETAPRSPRCPIRCCGCRNTCSNTSAATGSWPTCWRPFRCMG